ncbi:hypothetical protein GobsT_71160 [Gemmata obscuriglobus]|uniref:Uncharacterized protein n=1 Tax=Gemmata obscuriglobus TaxID=114 RepID=A0A2Z3HDV5_9BACT|nr:hypothetical protein [Gemmata obscuriglobus]AWM41777.1 hypothetical protein C1280_35470 [Gemmata obscuriglobus]QEG32263.1 hypothetical protein GobsT_71160 [Gemmata obscuriglobus]VTS11619.1 unnamed protein product [Gemmata obscuriglobus UQM 2246]
MPSREGYVQVGVQLPPALKVAADEKRGETTLTQYVCELIARDTGTEYEPPKKGAPAGTPRKTPPGPKPGNAKKPTAKRSRKT